MAQSDIPIQDTIVFLVLLASRVICASAALLLARVNRHSVKSLSLSSRAICDKLQHYILTPQTLKRKPAAEASNRSLLNPCREPFGLMLGPEYSKRFWGNEEKLRNSSMIDLGFMDMTNYSVFYNAHHSCSPNPSSWEPLPAIGNRKGRRLLPELRTRNVVVANINM